MERKFDIPDPEIRNPDSGFQNPDFQNGKHVVILLQMEQLLLVKFCTKTIISITSNFTINQGFFFLERSYFGANKSIGLLCTSI